MASTTPLECVKDAVRVGRLLRHPLRLRILREAREPASATAIATRLGLPRQRINYHVRELARAKFLRRAGRCQRRGLVEQNYVATAQAYVLSPEVLGELGADPSRVQDDLSAEYLLALAGQLQRELGQAAVEARRREQRLATLSINTELSFTSARQRHAFATALRRAVADVVGNFSGGKGEDVRPFRLVLGCYPTPPARRSR